MSSQEYFPTDLEFIPEDEQSHDELAQIQLFAYAMEPFQEPGLPYHNWEWHIKTSYLEAKRLYDDYQANKAEDQPDADFLVIAFAVLGHDSAIAIIEKLRTWRRLPASRTARIIRAISSKSTCAA